MHEMHLVKDIFADLLKLGAEQKAARITRIYLRLGTFTEINEEVLRFFFQEHGKDTILAGAELVIEPSQTRELRLLSFDCE